MTRMPKVEAAIMPKNTGVDTGRRRICEAPQAMVHSRSPWEPTGATMPPTS